jgi:hypothetical protein
LFLFHLWIWSEVLVLIIEGYWYYTEYPNPTISFSFFHLRKLMKNETFSFPSVSLQKGWKSSSSSSHKINIKINKLFFHFKESYETFSFFMLMFTVQFRIFLFLALAFVTCIQIIFLHHHHRQR